MNLALASVMLFTSLTFPSTAAGQTTEPGQTPPADSQTSAPTQAPVPASIPQPLATTDRPVSWKLLIPNLISDQKRIWTFPARLVQGQSWIPTAAVLGTTAGLVTLDPVESGYFRRTSTFHRFNTI